MAVVSRVETRINSSFFVGACCWKLRSPTTAKRNVSERNSNLTVLDFFLCLDFHALHLSPFFFSSEMIYLYASYLLVIICTVYIFCCCACLAASLSLTCTTVTLRKYPVLLFCYKQCWLNAPHRDVIDLGNFTSVHQLHQLAYGSTMNTISAVSEYINSESAAYDLAAVFGHFWLSPLFSCLVFVTDMCSSILLVARWDNFCIAFL